jgi:hypothetical protein
MESDSVTISIELGNAAWQYEDGSLCAAAIEAALVATASRIAELVSSAEGLTTESTPDGYPDYVIGFDGVIRDDNGNVSGTFALAYEGEVTYD